MIIDNLEELPNNHAEYHQTWAVRVLSTNGTGFITFGEIKYWYSTKKDTGTSIQEVIEYKPEWTKFLNYFIWLASIQHKLKLTGNGKRFQSPILTGFPVQKYREFKKTIETSNEWFK
jgi:hypothetical protein